MIEWAADGSAAHSVASALVGAITTAVLVEGESDRVAIETLAGRLGRDLPAEGVCVIPMGGAMSVGRFVPILGPRGSAPASSLKRRKKSQQNTPRAGEFNVISSGA